MENNELKKVSIKNGMCYYFHAIIKFEDYNFDSVLLDEKPYHFIQKFDWRKTFAYYV